MTDHSRPTSIGRYRVLDVLGKGSMGIVYKAHDPMIRRDVAVKVVHIDTDNAEEEAASIARFRQEVQAAGRCNHPAIVGIFDFVNQDGDIAIVMEMVDGTNLHRELRDPVKRAAISGSDVLLQVLGALDYAHGLGIVHRDIKPANILLTTQGKVKIADFGIARVAGSSSATQSGLILGTPSYMAPEQVLGETIDSRADLFAVGAILYEIVAGKPPFSGANITETIMRLSGPGTADMDPVAAAGGQAYVEILQQALAKDRTRRFQTADAFAAALRTARLGANTEAQQATVVLSAHASRTWDPALLQQLELHLARFVGPMARSMVTRAAGASASPEELYGALARRLPNPADRASFLRSVGGGRVEPSLSRGKPSERPIPPAAVTLNEARVISPEAAAAAQAALVVHTGPIARMLVRDAAAKSTSGKDFIERLCAHVNKPEELATLRRRLRAEVEPKLLG